MLDHRFGTSAAYTLGVEEEYMLLDPETWDLVQHIDSVLAAVAEGEFQARIYPELMQSVIEITTPVCRTPAEVDDHLRRLRSYVAKIAEQEGLPLRVARARIRSACSSASGSRRRTATGRSSTSCSTSRGAS